ncbi:shikimate dehydrogenase [Roseateles sp. YR242]|uniref:shikimate dehydrogenase family protein n=1 Tax=Roseateles sp. YR242 TaxID=1855305 RepID=UPI0008BAE60F|nr:shikimate dehydrogenase [Roseateles sp. YR242]SEL67528.1 shikimate dehydrogenase [Roseateles sp. YR242]
MTISGSTRVFLILGDPVAQVRAPEAFNHLFARHGIDAVLVPAQVPASRLHEFMRTTLAAQNIGGFWLAIPHKTAAIQVLDHCDRLGQSAQAVNAVRRNADGTLEGALFDGVGFTKALDHFGISITGSRVLVVGVGGGGVAIATSLAARGARAVALFDTATGRTAAIAQRLTEAFGVTVTPAPSAEPAGYDLVVNATPLGLQPGDPLPFNVDHLDADTVVVDILMKNQPTPLLRACQRRGTTAHPGFEMLVQQVPEYLSFFGYDEAARAVQADPSEVRRLLAGP